MSDKLEVGDRFEARDKRDTGKVVQVIEASKNEVRVVTEVFPKNPEAIGRRYWLANETLHKHYQRISR